MVSNIIDRIRLLFRHEKKPFLELKEILGFYPHNIKLYRLALMHKSVAHFERERLREEQKNSAKEASCDNAKGPKGRGKSADDTRQRGARRRGTDEKAEVRKTEPQSLNNERLEFLGDAVLGAIVADILYKHYGRKQEGFLTSLRSKIVCRESLNKLAVDLGLDKLILHTGAVTTAHNSYMNGNAFEAFFGAIYLDRGYKYCYKFLQDVVFKKYIDIDQVSRREGNFKSVLIEWCQKYKYRFEYKQSETRDMANHGTPVFKSSVLVEGIPCGTGIGYSKKEADQKASEQALKRLKKDKGVVNDIKHAIQNRKNAQLAEAK